MRRHLVVSGRRLTGADRARSIYRPGEHGFVYHFEREVVLEIQTCAAHAVYAFAFEREQGGYVFNWGAYAKEFSWVTPYYMKLIGLVRRLVGYPSVLQVLEHRWRAKRRAGEGSPAASAPGGLGSAADSPVQRTW